MTIPPLGRREAYDLLDALREALEPQIVQIYPDGSVRRMAGQSKDEFFAASPFSIASTKQLANAEQPRLTVDLAKKTATLDGKSSDVRSDRALLWLKVMAERPGQWISSSALESLDNNLINVRTDKLRKYLPAEILSLIDSEPGRGSRIRLT